MTDIVPVALSVNEVAALTCSNPQSVRRWIAAGYIQAHHLGGVYRVKAQDLPFSASQSMMTPDAAAQALGVHPKTIHNWIETDYLDAVRIGPRKLLINKADIEAIARGDKPYHRKGTKDATLSV